MKAAAWLLVSMAAAGVAPAAAAPAAPAAPAVTPQRQLVFSVHEDATTRKQVRQETDINQAFNGSGRANNVGMGGGTTSAVAAGTNDADVRISVLFFSAQGALGCDVSTSTAPNLSRRYWIDPDGTVRAQTSENLDRSVTFLLSLLATKLVPPDAGLGSTWERGRERFHVESADEEYLHLAMTANLGPSQPRARSETAMIDYRWDLFVPARAELTIEGRDELLTQAVEYHRHITYKLVSDSKEPPAHPG